MTTQEKIQQMIKDAEKSKAKIFATQGRDLNANVNFEDTEPPHMFFADAHAGNVDQFRTQNIQNGVTPTALYDEGYIM